MDWVLDANVLIGLRASGHLSNFCRFLNDSEPSITIHLPKEVYDELLTKDRRELEKLPNNIVRVWEKKDVGFELVQQVKKKVINWFGTIHTEKDADYLVLALGVKIGKCVLVTDDFDLYRASASYVRKSGLEKKILINGTPALITLMALTDRKCFPDYMAARMNTEMFENSELQVSFNEGLYNCDC